MPAGVEAAPGDVSGVAVRAGQWADPDAVGRAAHGLPGGRPLRHAGHLDTTEALDRVIAAQNGWLMGIGLTGISDKRLPGTTCLTPRIFIGAIHAPVACKL